MKRVFTFLSIVLLLSFAPARIARAQDLPSWKFLSPTDFGSAIQGTENNAQSSWFTGLQNASYGTTCMVAGYGCSDKPFDESYFRKSALGFTSDAIALTFLVQPANAETLIADVGHTLGFIPEKVYAQGIGFSGMLPLLPIWKVFRNVAYLLMAVIMVAIGFMVMFRKKLDPHTVITAQSAIPRVVIALILITFSYAIVGFAIDIMYVVMALVVAMFKSTGYITNDQVTASTGHLFQSIMIDPKLNIFRFFGINISDYIVNPVTAIIAIGTLFIGLSQQWVLVFTVISVIVPFIFFVATLYLYIRLLVFFVSAYIQIILALLIAPLQLLFEAVPGSTSFSSWFKNLIANLAVFPAAAALFMLAKIFQNIATQQPFWPTDTSHIWSPPFVGISTTTTAIASLVSLGVLFAIPQVLGSIKEALKAKSALPFDMGGAGGSAMNMLSTFYYLKMLSPSGLSKKLFGGKDGGPEQKE